MPKFIENFKRQNQMEKNFNKAMQKYSREMDSINDYTEKIYRMSREITVQSKRLIFLLQRQKPKKKEEKKILSEEENEIETKISLIKDNYKTLLSPDFFQNDLFTNKTKFFWDYHHKFQFSVHEYFESYLFYYYLSTQELIPMQTLKKNHEMFDFIHPYDYIMGVLDLSGELMRYAINCSSDKRKKDVVFDVCLFLQKLMSCFYIIRNVPDYYKKFNMIQGNVKKVENACYQITLQELEKKTLPKLL